MRGGVDYDDEEGAGEDRLALRKKRYEFVLPGYACFDKGNIVRTPIVVLDGELLTALVVDGESVDGGRVEGVEAAGGVGILAERRAGGGVSEYNSGV